MNKLNIEVEYVKNQDFKLHPYTFPRGIQFSISKLLKFKVFLKNHRKYDDI